MSAASQSLELAESQSSGSLSQASGSTQLTSIQSINSLKSAKTLSMVERVKKVQEYHKYTLECIEKNAWVKHGPLESIKNYFCIAFDPMEAKHWSSIDLIEFENRCKWEQLMRQDAIHGHQCKPGWNRESEDFTPASTKIVARASKALRLPPVLRTTQQRDQTFRTTETRNSVSCIGSPAPAVPFVPLAMQWYEIGRGTPGIVAQQSPVVLEGSGAASNNRLLVSPTVVATVPDLVTTQPLLSTWHPARRGQYRSYGDQTTVRGRALLKKLNSALQDPIEKSSVAAPFVGEMKRLEDDSWLVYSNDGQWKKATTRLI